ncbi:MAG: transglycosylase SLT domain-containing protein [Bacteroidetes bacterium]|nr:transglycosylase SLT domain-containing protein [Bacteroidota bacterium]
MQKKIFTAYLSLLAGFLTFLLFYSGTQQGSDPGAKYDSRMMDGKLPQVIRSIDLDKDFSFAGEKLPLDNFDVRERLDRELSVNSYWHSSTLLNLKQSARFFPAIEKILKEQGVPDDFKYLAVAESSLRPVTSPSGAKGFWQFLKEVGKSYGLTITSEVDERYHVEKATLAACKMLKDYKERFGNWTFAAAGYNMGSTSLAREIGNQKADTYYDMNLSEETMRYIFRIVALKEILNDPESFGFYLEEEDYYTPLDDYSVVMVEEPVDSWGEFAKEYGTTYRMLKVYNPWMRSYKLSGTPKEPLEVRLPR